MRPTIARASPSTESHQSRPRGGTGCSANRPGRAHPRLQRTDYATSFTSVDEVQPITALSIAGSDSGGGAGIQADLRPFTAFGVHGTTALTAITAQNTRGVTGVANIDPEIVRVQVLAVTDDFDVKAVKTGMLAMASTVEMV